MKIAIANDHSAVELKNIIKEHLESKGYEVLNLGTDSTESCVAINRKREASFTAHLSREIYRKCHSWHSYIVD